MSLHVGRWRSVLSPKSIGVVAGMSLALVCIAGGCGSNKSDEKDVPDAASAGTSGDAGVGGSAGTSGDAGVGGSAGGSPITIVDCREEAIRLSDPKCARPGFDGTEPGTFGSGPAIETIGAPFASAEGGFVDGDKLVIGVELSMDTDEYGAVISIDLNTGNRTIVSGKWSDPDEGDQEKGSGPDLNRISNVQPTASGKLVAITPSGLVVIDPATGERSLRLDMSDTLPCSIGAGAAVSIGPSSLDGMAVGPDDTVYLPFDNNPMGVGRGIVGIDTTGQCVVVTGDNGEASFGSGKPLDTGRLNGLLLADGKLYSVVGTAPGNNIALISVDLAAADADKGKRVVVSSPNKGTGPSIYSEGLTRDSSGMFWTWSPYIGMSGPVSIDPSTGNRVEYPLTYGPAVHSKGPGLWAPYGGSVLVGESENAIVLIETATGVSNTLSY